MGDKQRLFDAAPDDAWTRPETYIGAMARKRRFRRSKAAGRRTQPERPRLMLSSRFSLYSRCWRCLQR
jgi:hypothetical protein